MALASPGVFTILAILARSNDFSDEDSFLPKFAKSIFIFFFQITIHKNAPFLVAQHRVRRFLEIHDQLESHNEEQVVKIF